MIVADLDHFKAVNDSHGHTVGDIALKDVAYILRKQLRAFDLAYRLGGEEFLILVPGSDAGHTVELADRLRAAVAAETVAGSIEVTMSFGVRRLGARRALRLRRRFRAAPTPRCTAPSAAAATASAATREPRVPIAA